ncbi:MAG: hypothetical protein ACRCY4_00695 [Brevinema sp.]
MSSMGKHRGLIIKLVIGGLFLLVILISLPKKEKTQARVRIPIPENLTPLVALQDGIDFENTIWSNILVNHRYDIDRRYEEFQSNFPLQQKIAEYLYAQTNNQTNIFDLLFKLNEDERQTNFNALVYDAFYRQDMAALKKLNDLSEPLKARFYMIDNPFIYRYLTSQPEFFTQLFKTFSYDDFCSLGLKNFPDYAFIYALKNRDYTTLDQWMEVIEQAEKHYSKTLCHFYWDDTRMNSYDYNRHTVLYYALFDPNAIAVLSQWGRFAKVNVERAQQQDFHGAIFSNTNIYRILQHIERDPELINYSVVPSGLSAFNKFRDDTNFIKHLETLGLNKTNWELARFNNELYTSVERNQTNIFLEAIENGADIDGINDEGYRPLRAFIQNLNYDSYPKEEVFEFFGKEFTRLNVDVDYKLGGDSQSGPVNSLEEMVIYSHTRPIAIERYIKYIPMPQKASFYRINNEIVEDTKHPYGGLISYAVLQNQAGVIKAMIDKGYLDPTQSAVSPYVQLSLVSNSADVARAFHSAGASIPTQYRAQLQEWTRTQNFFNAVFTEDSNQVEQFLKENPTDINTRDARGNTVLHMLLEKEFSYRQDEKAKKIAFLKYLHEKGLDFTLTNYEYPGTYRTAGGQSAVVYFFRRDMDIWFGDDDFLEYLKAGFPIPPYLIGYDSNSEDENTNAGPYDGFWQFAMEVNATNIMKIADQQGYLKDSLRITNIFASAVSYGKNGFVDLLLSKGMFLDYKDKSNQNLVEIALGYPNYDSIFFDHFYYGRDDLLKQAILRTYKDKILKVYPQYHELLNYTPKEDPNLPNSIGSIQARLLKEKKPVPVIFDPLDFNTNERVLFTKNIDKNTPLDLLINTKGFRQKKESLSAKYIELFQFLLTNGADPNYINPITGDSLLMTAAISTDTNFLEILRKRSDIDYNHTNILGNTVLHHVAAMFSDDPYEMSPVDVSNIYLRLPVEKIGFDRLNNAGQTAYWIYYGQETCNYNDDIDYIKKTYRPDLSKGTPTTRKVDDFCP